MLIGADDVIAGHASRVLPTCAPKKAQPRLQPGWVRVLAAEKLGLAELPVIVHSHLSESQRQALVIADNRITENAGWDEAMLKAEIVAMSFKSGENLSRRMWRVRRSTSIRACSRMSRKHYRRFRPIRTMMRRRGRR